MGFKAGNVEERVYWMKGLDGFNDREMMNIMDAMTALLYRYTGCANTDD